jgi:hypothetical protein
MSKKPAKPVRFYFGVFVSYLIPPNPHTKRGGLSKDKWEDGYLEKLRDDVSARLSKEGFDAAYRKHAPIDNALRLYAVDFVVSALHLFPAVQIFSPRRGFGGFRVKARPFSKAKTTLERKIAGALKMEYVINTIAYEYAASRTFVYEEYLGGVLRIEHIISQREIKDAGGTIRGAIEQFNNEVSDFLESHYSWEVWPKLCTARRRPTLKAASLKIPTRRPTGNVYEFEVLSTRHYGYSEEEVCGDLALLKKDTPALLGKDVHTHFEELDKFDIDTIDADHTSKSTECEAELRGIIENSPYTLVDLTVSWEDYDDHVYDIQEELL